MSFSFIPFSGDPISGPDDLLFIYDSKVLLDAARPYGTTPAILYNQAFSSAQIFFGPKTPFTLSGGAEYSVAFNAVCRKGLDNFVAKMEVYVVGPGMPARSPLGTLIATYEVGTGSVYQVFDLATWNFTALHSDNVYVRFVVYGGQWHVSDVSLKPASEFGFTPDSVNFLIPVNGRKSELIQFRTELYDINNTLVPITVDTSPVFFDGGNFMVKGTGNRVSGELLVVPSGSGGATITTKGFTDKTGSFQTGGTAIFIGAGQHANQNTAFLVASSSAGPVFSISDRIIAEPSGSSYVVTINTGQVNLQSPNLQLKGNDTGSATSNVIRLGINAGAITFTSGTGIYMDGGGNFRLGDPTAGSLSWNGSTLAMSGSFFITGGNGATQAYVLQQTSSLSSSVIPYVNAQDQSYSGSLTSDYKSRDVAVSQSFATVTFTDATGFLTKNPAPSGNGLYIGSSNLGYYSGGAWKAYLDSLGNFFLTGSGTDSLSWNGTILTINGAINITGGNAATTAYVLATSGALSGSVVGYVNTQDLTYSSSFAGVNFTNSSGSIIKAPTPTGKGLFLGSTQLGYYSGSAWQTYMDNTGKFFLTGSASNFLQWDGSTLTIAGAITITGGNAATQTFVLNATSSLSSSVATYTNTQDLSYSSSIVSYANTQDLAYSSSIVSYANTQDANNSSSLAGSIPTSGSGKLIKTPGITNNSSGLYLTSQFIGYWTGTQFNSYISASGTFQFLGNANNFISWDGSQFTVKAQNYVLKTTTVNIDSTVSSGLVALFSASAFDTGSGIWMDGTGRFRVGDPLGQRISYDSSLLTVSASAFDLRSSNTAISSVNGGSILLVGSSSIATHTFQGGVGAYDIFSGSMGSIYFSLNTSVNNAITIAQFIGGLESDYTISPLFYIRDIATTSKIKVWAMGTGALSGSLSASVPSDISTMGAITSLTSSFSQFKTVIATGSVDIVRQGYTAFQITGSAAKETHFRPFHSSSRFIIPVGTNLYATR